MEKIRIKYLPPQMVPLDNAEYFCISPDLKILSYVKEDALTFVPLNEEFFFPSCLGKFKRYLWQEDYCSNGKYHVLTLTYDNFLFIYEVAIQKQGNSFTCIFAIFHEWELSSMVGIPDICYGESKIEILSYSQQRIVLLFEEKIVISIVSLPNQLPVCQLAFQIAECDSPISYHQVHEDMLFTLNKNGTAISLYSIDKGEKQFEWHVQSIFNYPADWSSITKFCVASDFDTAVICNCKHSVFKLQLKKTLRIEQKSLQKVTTAFVKKIPSLTKVSERTETVMNRSQLTLVHEMELPSDLLEDICIEDIVLMGNNSILLHFRNRDKTDSILLSFSDSGSINIQERFPETVSIIKTSGTSPLLFISANNICTYLFNASAERLVGELMICYSGEAAEKLSGLNNWQDIEVKLEVLQHGLKNRQLDVISFYLRTQEEAFHRVWSCPCEENSKWSTLIVLQAQHWKSIIDMLLDAIKESIHDTSSCQFAEQLLQLTVSTLTNLVNVVNSEDQRKNMESFDELVMKLSIQFGKYFQEARSLLHGQCAQIGVTLEEMEHVEDEILYNPVSEEIQSISEHWQDGVRHAVKENNLLSVQAYLMSKHKKEEWLRNESLWNMIISIGTKVAEESLSSGNFKEAIEIFANMGLSPDDKVLDIFKTTTSSHLRESLLEELKRECLLSEKDQKIINYIKEIENVYPCRSVEEAKVNNEFRDETSHNGNSSNSNLYSNVVFNWVSKWNEDTCFRIILFAAYGLKNFSFASLPSHICWEFFIEYGKVQDIQNWASVLSSKKAIHETEFLFPCGWTIRDSMLNCIKPLSVFHIQEIILDSLARFSVFCEEESEDFPLLLRRLGHINFMLTDMSLFDSENSTISASDFVHRVIHYSLQNDLSNFLYHFLKEKLDSIQPFPHCIYCSTPLLSVISAFTSWSKKSNDSDLAFQSMMAVAQYVYNMPEASIQSLWKHASVNIIMAITLFAPIQLCRLSHGNCKKVMGVDSTFVQSSLSSIPLLCDTLFKRDKDNNATKLDVTVYHLLQENALFDPTQLFGWQTTNNIINEDAMPELPHFSLPNLVDVFGYKRKLTFHYYLLNGRPNFAYVKFIMQEFSSSGTPSSRRIAAACKEAIIIAIRNYHDIKVTSSCIAFTEMLGQDSLSVRTHIHVAKIICDDDNRLQEMADGELIGQLEASFYNRAAAKEILSSLEFALSNKISKIRNPGLEIMWSIPVINFCHIHQLDPPTSYMEQCAKNGDWLTFLAFAQVFQIQLNQVLKLLGTFSNAYLVDHLSNALQWKRPNLSSVHMEKSSLPDQKMKTKQKMSEFRKVLYERIGVAKQEKSSNTASAPELSSDDEGSSLTGSDETITSGDFVTLCEDLWGQILLCHNTVCPWRSLLHASCSHHNPLLAVIASSYQGASIHHCLAMWLYTSVSTTSPKEDMVLKDIADIEETMKEAISSRKVLLLQKAFKIFQPNSPLLCLINFLAAFLIQKQYESSVDYLKQFQRHLWNYSSSGDDEMATFADVGWLQKTCVMLLTASISSCETLYEKKILLRHYFFAKIQSTFSSVEKIPDFNKLYHLIQSVGDLNVKVYVEDLLQPEHTDKYKNACIAIIQKLQQAQHNDEAYVFAKVSKLPLDEVLLYQIKNEMQKYRSHSDWNDMKKRIQFWEQCMNTLHIGNVKPLLAAHFFKEESDKSTSYIEKFMLTRLAVRWMLEENPVSKETRKAIGEMEISMWLYCIKAEVEINRMEAADKFYLDIEKCCDDSLDFLAQEIENPSFVPLKLSSEEELSALNQISGKMLNLGNVKEAQNINQIFSHKSVDVHIIVTCIKLAKQEITPDDIDSELRKLISEMPSVKTIRKGGSFIPFRISEGKDVKVDKEKGIKEDVQKPCLTAEQEEIASLIKQLGEKSAAASLACKRILIYYLSSQVLQLTYDEVRVQEQSFKLLKAILTCSYPDKYVIAKELLAVNSTTDDEVTEFLSQEILISLQVYCGTAEFSMTQSNTELILNPSNMSDTFQHLLYLCEDPSLLGTKLLNIVDREIENKPENWTKPNLCLIVELYIRSHDCFTAACNMEGISRILQQARKMARRLTDAEECHLLVRMLTGIARYSEMTYVFDILREKHQFELLFRKGMEKVPHLRLALLDYLKHCCSIDSYVYPMLALNFSMFREIAEMLEASAKESLKVIRKKNQATTNVKDDLLAAMQEFADAAESYSKADCIGHADRCVKQAKLVALQTYLLPKSLWIIELNNKAVSRIIAEHPKFSESYLIAEAYQHHSSWDHALHRNVIQKGDWNYFAEFNTTIGLSSVLMEDISRRLLLYSPKCENEIHNLKKLLQKCDAEIRYKIASDFGFKDVMSDLLKGDYAPYIKDLMYKFH